MWGGGCYKGWWGGIALALYTPHPPPKKSWLVVLSGRGGVSPSS